MPETKEQRIERMYKAKIRRIDRAVALKEANLFTIEMVKIGKINGKVIEILNDLFETAKMFEKYLKGEI